MDLDGHGLDSLIDEFSKQLPTLLRSTSADDFQLLKRGARVIAFSAKPEPISKAIGILIDVGFAMTIRAQSMDALPLLEKAIDLAQANDLLPELRRAYNAYGGISTESGFPARGVECAVRAIQIAEQLGDKRGLVAAQSNLTAAMHMMGLYRECVALAGQIVIQSEGQTEVSNFVAGARVNMANSALALQQYQLAADTSKQAAEAMGLPRDGNSIFTRLVCESTWLKSAIGLDDRLTATTRLRKVQALADAFKTPRTELNRQLAEAAFEIYSGDLTIAVAKLLKLLDSSKALPALYRDNLTLLVRAYEKAHDHTGVLIYLGKLVEFLAKSQVDNVKRALDALKVKVQTPMPGKDDVQDLIMAIQRDEPFPAKSQVQVPLSLILETYDTFALTAEVREDASGRHMYRVGRLARLLSGALGHAKEFSELIERAARLHDIGKLGLPDEVILNAGRLSPEQHQAMQRHCEIGVNMIDQTNHPALSLAREVAQSHHERWDGAGYPQKLKGDAIPLSARIAAIAETYDVLTHERRYRPARMHAEAFAIIQENAGSQFDPNLVPVFAKIANSLYEKYGDDLPEFLAEAANESSFLQAKDEMGKLIDAL
jgi:putative two-component system response regulator